MRFKFGVIATFAALAGCHSADDIHAKPVIWTGTYTAPYDTMANCLATSMLTLWVNVTPLMYPNEKRARVLSSTQAGSVMTEFEVVQVSPTQSEVRYRSAFVSTASSSLDRDLRERAERCARPQ